MLVTKQFAFLVTLVLILTAPPPSLGQDGASDGVIMRRATLIVRDAERAIAFYRDVLGFSVWLEQRGTVSENSLPVDVPAGSPSRFVIMKGRDPYVGMVGLLQYGEAQPAPSDTDARRIRAGDTVLMIETDDIERVYAQALSGQAAIHRPPGDVVRIVSAEGNEWDARFMFVFDPDGNMVEVTERLN